jgi:NAD(P) transhydrogenase subunit beta
MPILDADTSHTVLELKRSLNPGFAGEVTSSSIQPNTMMVFGDAKATLTSLIHLLKKAATPDDSPHVQIDSCRIPASGDRV